MNAKLFAVAAVTAALVVAAHDVPAAHGQTSANLPPTQPPAASAPSPAQPQAASSPAEPSVDQLINSATAIINSTGTRDMDHAVALLREAVSSNNATAMRKLAAVLLNGDGVPADPAGAEALLKQAVAAGDRWGGASELGDLYRADTPLKNAQNAVAAFQIASDAENTGAMSKEAAILLHGADGVPADPPRAEALLKQAVATGDTKWAAADLGDLYRADTPLKNPALAMAAYQQSADAGNPDSMVKLATMLVMGEGSVAPDFMRAEALLQQAMAAGDAQPADAALGDLYLAPGPLKNAQKAMAAYDESARAGDVSSMLALAGMLTDGREVPLDLNRAKTLLDSALAAGGTSRAAFALGGLYLRPDFPEHNPTLARSYYEQSAKAGNTDADLAIVTLTAANFSNAADLDSAVGHARDAAGPLGKDAVLDDLMRLPSTSLVAIVQHQLSSSGATPGTVDGFIGPKTMAAIGAYCKRAMVTDCASRMVTRPIVDSLVFGPSA